MARGGRTPGYVLAALLLTALAGCSGVFFQPSRDYMAGPALRIFPPEDVTFLADDGTSLHGWFVRAADPRGSILILHGNAENISTHINNVLWLVPEGFNIFIIDYRGYGLSEGRPTLAGVQRDADAALHRLLTLPTVDPNKIIVLGQSLGGAIAVNMVATTPLKDHVRALVVDSAFSSHRLIAREKLGDLCLTWPLQYPLSFLFNDDYSPARRIKDVTPVPLLIIHGDEDPVVPFHHAAYLYDAAAGPKELWRTSSPGHIRSFTDREVRDRFVAYLRDRLQKDAGTPGDRQTLN